MNWESRFHISYVLFLNARQTCSQIVLLLFYFSESTIWCTLVRFYCFSLTGSLFLFVFFVESAGRMENARCQKNGLNSRDNSITIHKLCLHKLWICILEYDHPYLLRVCDKKEKIYKNECCTRNNIQNLYKLEREEIYINLYMKKFI